MCEQSSAGAKVMSDECAERKLLVESEQGVVSASLPSLSLSLSLPHSLSFLTPSREDEDAKTLTHI